MIGTLKTDSNRLFDEGSKHSSDIKGVTVKKILSKQYERMPAYRYPDLPICQHENETFIISILGRSR